MPHCLDVCTGLVRAKGNVQHRNTVGLDSSTTPDMTAARSWPCQLGQPESHVRNHHHIHWGVTNCRSNRKSTDCWPNMPTPVYWHKVLHQHSSSKACNRKNRMAKIVLLRYFGAPSGVSRAAAPGGATMPWVGAPHKTLQHRGLTLQIERLDAAIQKLPSRQHAVHGTSCSAQGPRQQSAPAWPVACGSGPKAANAPAQQVASWCCPQR
jgi:hypothetical protein